MVKWCQVDIHHLLLTYIILYAKKRYSRDLLFTGCWLEKLYHLGSLPKAIDIIKEYEILKDGKL